MQCSCRVRGRAAAVLPWFLTLSGGPGAWKVRVWRCGHLASTSVMLDMHYR